MISGLDLNAVIDFILPEDTENPTVWKLGIISNLEFTRITEQEKSNIMIAYMILQVAIKGWENYNIPFTTKKEKVAGKEMDVVPFEILEGMPLTAISGIHKKVLEISKLSGEEAKN